MNVLSLFDGISCGQVALNRAGIKVDNYYASEIDKHAIKVTQYNHPDTIQLGDITQWRNWDIDWSTIDLLIFGSPCQGFSFAGKQLNFGDERSALFFTAVDILKHCHPKYFLMENVRMKKEYSDKITETLVKALNSSKCYFININSSLLSAQNRNRYYWTNIEGVTQPDDKGILLKDIVRENTYADRDKSYCIDASYAKGGNCKSYYEKHRRQQVIDVIQKYTVPFNKSLIILDKEVQKGKVGYFGKDSQANRVYHIHGKSVKLLGEAGGCITPDRLDKRQNGQRFSNGKKFYTLAAQDRHGVLIDGYIRKLTPTECERLQTLPSDYTKVEGVSDSQRYKMIGNGWTVDVISHIFSNIVKDK